MSYDAALLSEELRRDEGLRLKPYHCSAGKLTIGIGRNLDDVGIRESEALVMLQNDIEHVESQMDTAMPWWRDQPDDVQRALMNMGFQLGIGGLSKFRKMLAALQAGDRAEAARQALDSRWARQTPARAARVASLIAG